MRRGLTALVALLLPAVAMAQEGFEASGFNNMANDGDIEDFLELWRPEPQRPGSVGLSGLLQYANEPLVLVTHYWDSSESKAPLLNNLFGMNLGVHAGLHKHIGLAATLPVWAASSSMDGTKGPALGDLRVSLPIGLVVGKSDNYGTVGFGLSLTPQIDLPTGAPGRFLGNEGVGVGGVLAASYGAGRVLVATNVGLLHNPQMQYRDMNGPDRLFLALATSVRLSETLGLRLEGTVEPSIGDNLFKDVDIPAELSLSMRSRTGPGFSWTGGAGLGVGRGPTAAAFRLFAGVGYVFGKDKRVDVDGDGITGANDLCPTTLEVYNGYLDDDGCPDELATLNIQVKHPTGAPAIGVPVMIDGESVGRVDSIGRFILSEQMPGGSVSVTVGPSDDGLGLGAVTLDNVLLQEGEHGLVIELPYQLGRLSVRAAGPDGPIDALVSFRGPRDVGTLRLGEDGVGSAPLFPGEWQVFVEAPGMAVERRQVTIARVDQSVTDLTVSMRPAVVQTTGDEVVLLQSVEFESGKAVVAQSSLALLAEVATNLQRQEQIRMVEVQGHTDSQGGDADNLQLSQARVEAVLRLLVASGIEPGRLRAIGFGEMCPIANNDTAAGRASNRRVQFFIADPTPAAPIPCHEHLQSVSRAGRR